MILPPSEWYAKQDLSQHFMRRTDRPFKEGVSRGQIRRIVKCEASGYRVQETPCISLAYGIVSENRRRKGREYGMSLDDWLKLKLMPADVYCFLIEPFPTASALCVRVSPQTLYVSAWGDVPGMEELSPVCLLARHIYNWCAANKFHTLDIGVAGDEGLASFKRRLGFKRACDAE